ncbi:MAG TPA: hypothetical protein PKI94_03195 [Candidatus Gastranaerophilaceae bacterium]|nr:hypothetical protein [Candidatus Gastranaerophilaceae bacterium]
MFVDKESHSNVSFEGTGSLLIKYHKYSEKMGQEILQLMEQKVGKLSGDIKSFLKSNGALNEAGDLVGLKPKSITILDGNEYFDEEILKDASFIFQRGGSLDKVIEVDKIKIEGGQNVGIRAKFVSILGDFKSRFIFADDLKARNSKLDSYVEVKNAEFYNSSNLKKMSVSEDLDLYGKSKVRNSTVGDLYLDNASFADNVVVKNNFSAWENSRALRLKIQNNADLHDSAVLSMSGVEHVLNTCNKSRVSHSVAGSFYAHNNSILQKVVALRHIGAGHSSIVKSSISKGDLVAGNSASVSDVTVKKSSLIGQNAFATKLKTNTLKVIDSARVENSLINGDLSLRGDSVAVNVKVGDCANVLDWAKLQKSEVKRGLTLHDNGQASDIWVQQEGLNVNDTAGIKNIVAPKYYLYDRSTIGGKIQGKINYIDHRVKINPDTKFDAFARHSLPITRFRAKFLSKYSLKV